MKFDFGTGFLFTTCTFSFVDVLALRVEGKIMTEVPEWT